MLQRFRLKRRLRHIGEQFPQGLLLEPDYLLAVVDCLDTSSFKGYRTDLAHRERLPLHHPTEPVLRETIVRTLTVIEMAGRVETALLRSTDQCQTVSLDVFLINEHRHPIHPKELHDELLINIKQLLTSVLLYRDEDEGRYRYYVRKLQTLFSDINTLLEALLKVALR